MAQFHFELPLKKEDVMQLTAGDLVYLSGTILTARDEAHARILELGAKGEKLPFDLEATAIYHCGPLMQQQGTGWFALAAGPTTSARMSKMTPALLDRFNVTALIGKGGMQNLTEVMKGRCVYLAFTGGCAALAAEHIIQVRTMHWPDLGMAEAVWELVVKDLGPLVVGIDAKGNDLFKKTEEKARSNFSGLRL